MVKNSLREAKEETRKRRLSFEEESKQRRSEMAKTENKIPEISDKRSCRVVRLFSWRWLDFKSGDWI